MDASGGMGTLNPPSDGDDFAEVTPLRRRDPHLAALPTVRDPLPAEASVWETDLPDDPPLRRSRTRQMRGALAIGWRAFRSRLPMPRTRPVAISTVLLACVAAAAAAALTAGSGAVTGRHRTALSSLAPRASSTAKVSAPAAHSARRPIRHKARHQDQHAIRRRRPSLQVRARRGRSFAHGSSVAQAAPWTPTTTATATTTPAPSTPVVNSGGAASPARAASTSQSSRPGPTGSGAAFGPGY